ncbi:hypothetical protein GGQ97_000624 [Sphingomonas kaistensis]|uniref:META domain-containing protein n=1 Tax=Sphingomonas kaistensis TaxID=298708 RepID=A0A7X5Y4B1_9SPHN|nr:hypothetical protein [Sphingomonas kaistensis]NJC04831.1 hypothetical protein [Sphingomonas kaistensis]
MTQRTLTTFPAIVAIALGLSACMTAPAQTDSAGLAGTMWSVEAVNGQSTAGRSDFTVAFSGTTFDARFGCRRATGNYAITYASNGDPRPGFRGYNARISGSPCTGTFAEQLGPEIISTATFSLDRQTDGRLMMAQPPTFILLRPLRR